MSRVLKHIQWVLRASTRPPHKERNETRRDRIVGDEPLPELGRDGVAESSLGGRLAHARHGLPPKLGSSSSYER